MKKLFIFLFLLIICPNVFAQERITVKFNKCVDGDTAWFNAEEKIIKARFLAIDTPESTKEVEPYGKEASKYTCDELKKAQIIEIEYDDNSDKKDKYDRDLVWVFVDNNLLQNKIVRNGYAEVAYLYDEYKYTSTLQESEKQAKQEKLNIWSDYKEKNDTWAILLTVVVIILLYIFIPKYRKKINNKIKKKIDKRITNTINDI